MKKGISAISGVTSPTVGEKYTYHISEWYPNTPISEREQAKVTWELFKKRSDGRFTTTHIKKKGDSSFTFGESSVGETYRLEGYLYQPEGGGLIITPKASKIPKICKVDLNYVDDSKGSVFSFTEKLRAKAHCINMFNKEVLFTLWEDDAKGSGHNTTNQLIDTKKAKVDLYGDAEVDFMLTKALMKKAMEGETDIRELEFYVTVEYYKTKKHTTSNVEIKNPSPTENKKPSQPTAIKKAKGSPAEHKPRSKKEEKGVFRSISETIDEIWDWAETQGIAQRDKPHTIEIPEGKSPAVIGKTKVERASSRGTDCGERYCIKKGDKSELIREINIRLAGFGGNVPTDEFTERTEKMIKQFQRDYMKVPETGKVCGNVLRAIDDFSTKFDIGVTFWNQLKCSCSTKGQQTTSKLRKIKELNKCTGFGDHTGKGTYKDTPHSEANHNYEYPGIHRSLLFGIKALKFYFSKQTMYTIDLISSGYRCRFKNYNTTNHQGKAIDIQFSENSEPIRYENKSNLPKLRDIRDEFYIKYLGAQKNWPDEDKFSIEPIDLLYDKKGNVRYDHTFSWIHIDVREFKSIYLDDKYFCKDSNGLNGKSIVLLAQELGFKNVCNCLASFTIKKPQANNSNCTTCKIFEKTRYEFYEEFGNTAIKTVKNFGKSNKFKGLYMVAQRRQENGFDKEVPNNNPMNIKGKGDLGSKAYNTHEEVNGKKIPIKDGFANFSSVEKGFMGYVDLLKTNYKEAYVAIMDDSKTIDDFLIGLQDKGKLGSFATASNYKISVKNIFKGVVRDYQKWLECKLKCQSYSSKIEEIKKDIELLNKLK